MESFLPVRVLFFPSSVNTTPVRSFISFISENEMSEESVALAAIPSSEKKVDTSHLAKQDLKTLDVTQLTPLSPEVISRQATINIGKFYYNLLCSDNNTEIYEIPNCNQLPNFMTFS
jgi:hypothetical protein